MSSCPEQSNCKQFHTKTNEAMHATVTDATSKIRATFSKGAIKEAAEKIGNPFSETAGRVFTLLDYHIVIVS